MNSLSFKIASILFIFLILKLFLMKSLFTRKSLAVVSAFFVASIVTSCHDEEVANIEELSYRHAYERNSLKLLVKLIPTRLGTSLRMLVGIKILF